MTRLNMATAGFVFLQLILLASRIAAQQPGGQQTGFKKTIQPFLQQHCHACHSGEDAEGSFRTDDLLPNFEDHSSSDAWSEIVNVLNSHQMPPEDEPQPATDEVSKVVDWIAAEMATSELAKRKSTPVLRRLNRAEYGNTLRDLLGISIDLSAFPEDAAAGGFDNNGGALTLSPMLMELYYRTAEKAIDACLVTGQQPPVMKWRIQPESGDNDSNRVEYDGQRLIVNGGQNAVNGDYKVMHHNSWDRTINFRDFAVTHPGTYRIRIRAASKVPSQVEVAESARSFLADRQQRDDKERPEHKKYHQEAFDRDMEHFRTDPMYQYGPPRLKLIQTLAGQPKVIAEMDIPATLDSPDEYVIETDFTTDRAGVTIEYAYSIPAELENFWMQSSDQFARPELWIDWIELEGPIYPQWPPASHQQLLQTDVVDFRPKNEKAARQQAGKILKRFMQYAYRRPVTNDELLTQMSLFDSNYQQHGDFVAAIKVPLVAVLVSPDFLYLNPPSQPVTDRIQQYQLATRLSYFLWSSMPDDTLLRLAGSGQLQKPAVLQQQVNRMLADPKSDALVTNFAGQWLGLREVGANPPASDLYPRYDRHLEQSIVMESEAFFRYILDQDLDAMNFVDSDFVTINERLARYYQIPDVSGDHFRPVMVPTDVHRGGVMTQASMLSTTSNGTRTSPVKRGTWILKNVLGMDPGLPVANAGDIAPKVPGIDKATVRQRLEIHRSLPQCARCHNRIDPLGFALENYNAAGAWRDQEGFGYKGRINRDDPVIDASGQMIDGRKFDGIDQLQELLTEDDQPFLSCLSQKMLTYALGRELSPGDQPDVNNAVKHMQDNHRTLRSLIQWITAHPKFQQL